MFYNFTDTETTGLESSDEVIQFASIITDKSLEIKGYINFYGYTTMPIEVEAARSHGITSERLAKLSGYKTFEDSFLSNKILQSNQLTWVGYNLTFDLRLINQTFAKYKLPKKSFGRAIPSLKYAKDLCYYDMSIPHAKTGSTGGRYFPKLGSIIEEEIPGGMDSAKKLFNLQFGKELEYASETHNALFDAYLLYLLVKKDKFKYL